MIEEQPIEEKIQSAATTLREARMAAESDDTDRSRLFTALENLAGLHSLAGNFQKSESLYLEALETGERFSSPPERMASLRSALATLYDFNKREDQAVPLYEQAIEDYEKMTPPQDELSAQLRNNLAMIYKSLEKYAQAEQHYLMALESMEKIHGRYHEHVAALFNNIGGLYYAAGHPEQAKEMHLDALKVRSKVLGPMHPEVAQSYCNLATACYAMNDEAGAVRNYEKSLAVYEENLDTCADSYRHVGEDCIAVLESVDDTRKASEVRRRIARALRNS
ncbi:MAG: tetratricopeptide repeat protein [Verrucomicrobiaceae bacterium]